MREAQEAMRIAATQGKAAARRYLLDRGWTSGGGGIGGAIASVGRGIGRAASSIGRAAGSAVSSLGEGVVDAAEFAAPYVQQALPAVQTALKNMGPIGMAASGALAAVAAGIQGKDLEQIAWAAAEGAAPSGVDAAIGAARRLREGGNVIGAALSAAGQQFAPGTPAAEGFEVGKALLSGQNVTKAALSAARNRLGSEAARVAFDAAVGTAARLAQGKPTPGFRLSPQQRAQIDALRKSHAKSAASGAAAAARGAAEARKRAAAQAGARAAAASASAAARAGAARSAALAARNRKRATVPTTTTTTQKAPMARPLTAPNPLASIVRQPRRLALQHPSIDMAARTIRRNPGLAALGASTLARRLNVPEHTARRALASTGRALRSRPLSRSATAWLARLAPFSRDVGALEADGRTWLVKSGDYPFKIAQQLTGDGNRWRELAEANRSIAFDKAGKNLWAQNKNFHPGMRLTLPASWVSSGPEVLPEVTIAVPAPTNGAPQIAGIMQAKAMLVAWSKSDGAQHVTLTDYGGRTEDLSTTFGPRDRLVLSAFSRWRGGLPTDGALTQAHIDALRSWVEQRAQLPAPTTPALPSPVLPPPAVTSPGLPPTVPAAPSLPPPVTAPTPPAITAPDPIAQKPPAPAAPATPARRSSSEDLAAIGAVLGLAALVL